MNEKTRAQIEAMKNQTIGVEIEMNNITREKAAKKAAEFFGTGRYEYTAGRNGYFAWSAWDAQGREWKFQRDVSIEGPDSQKCELVTPILIYDDIEMLQKLVRLLRKAGAKSSPSRGCGVHIHIGKGNHTRRVSATWSTSWQPMRHRSAGPSGWTRDGRDNTAGRSTRDSWNSSTGENHAP